MSVNIIIILCILQAAFLSSVGFVSAGMDMANNENPRASLVLATTFLTITLASAMVLGAKA